MMDNRLLLCILLLVIYLVDTAQVRRSDNDLEQFLRFKLDGLFSIDPDLKTAAKEDRLQPQMPSDMKFICNVTGTRSPTRPSSIHRLRPGDFDVIGALGDSLTAGTGATASLFMEALLNNQPVSWSMGGFGTWRKYLTLPNIIKEFNPNLIGQTTRWGRDTMNNVAGAGATSADVPAMALELVTRIRNNPKIDFQNDWKLVTMMIGANDICSEVCYYKDLEGRYDAHKKNMILALRILRSMPRTFVNYVPVPDITVLMKHNYPIECEIVHKVECPCMFGQQYEKWRRKYLRQVVKHWQQLDADVAGMAEFNNNDDFAVVLQPFTTEIQLPMKHNTVDLTAMSRDCFHFSQKGYARAANAVWNNMMEPVNNKSTNWSELFERFLCPTALAPYIYTSRNSADANIV